MKKLVFVNLLCSLLILSACNIKNENQSVKQEIQNKPSLEFLQVMSDSMAEVLKNDIPKIDIKKYNFAIARNIDIYSNYPKSENAAKSLDLVQGYASQIENHSLSAKMSEKLIYEYPKYKNNERIIFELANDYNLFLKDTIKAKHFFNLLLEKYPNTKFKSDTKFVLKNLGKSLEQLFLEAN